MASATSDTFENVRGQAAQLFQSIVEQATARAMEGTQRKKGNRATRFVRPHRKSSPTVRDIAFNAASGAIELWQAARDRAESTVDVVQHTVADSASGVKSSAVEMKDEAVDRARHVVADGAHLVGDAAHRVGDTAHRAADSGKSAAHRAADSGKSAAHRAADTSKSAAHSGADAGKNTVGFVFWATAAGAIIYYAFLDEQRRAQARDIAMKAISEARTLLRDLQGEDGEFA